MPASATENERERRGSATFTPGRRQAHCGGARSLGRLAHHSVAAANQQQPPPTYTSTHVHIRHNKPARTHAHARKQIYTYNTVGVVVVVDANTHTLHCRPLAAGTGTNTTVIVVVELDFQFKQLDTSSSNSNNNNMIDEEMLAVAAVTVVVVVAATVRRSLGLSMPPMPSSWHRGWNFFGFRGFWGVFFFFLKKKMGCAVVFFFHDENRSGKATTRYNFRNACVRACERSKCMMMMTPRENACFYRRHDISSEGYTKIVMNIVRWPAEREKKRGDRVLTVVTSSFSCVLVCV